MRPSYAGAAYRRADCDRDVVLYQRGGFATRQGRFGAHPGRQPRLFSQPGHNRGPGMPDSLVRFSGALDAGHGVWHRTPDDTLLAVAKYSADGEAAVRYGRRRTGPVMSGPTALIGEARSRVRVLLAAGIRRYSPVSRPPKRARPLRPTAPSRLTLLDGYRVDLGGWLRLHRPMTRPQVDATGVRRRARVGGSSSPRCRILTWRLHAE